MKKAPHYLFCTLGSLLLFFAFTIPVNAQGIGDNPSNRSTIGDNPSNPGTIGNNPLALENPLESDDIFELLSQLLDVLMVFAVPLIVFMIIYAGFLYVTARGNPGQIGTAHKALTYAVVGGVLILGAWVILEVIQGTVDAFR